jgi:hypothetical protein
MDGSGQKSTSWVPNPGFIEGEAAVLGRWERELPLAENPQHQGSGGAMERRLNPAGTIEWNAPVEETTDEMAPGKRDGNRFFRGVIAAGLISLPFWALAGWFLVSYLVK